MLLTSFVAEVNFDNKAIHFSFYGVSCLCWLFILFSLNSALKALPATISEAKRGSIGLMFMFIFVGWIIYPLGFLAPTLGLEPDIREFCYNIGDIINKVGLGLVIIVGGFKEQKQLAVSA